MKNYNPIETLEVETLNLTKNIILISIYIPPSSKIKNAVKKSLKVLLTILI